MFFEQPIKLIPQSWDKPKHSQDMLSTSFAGREEQSLEMIMKSTETKFTLRFEKGGFILSKLDSHDKVLASEMLPMPSSMYSIFKDDDGAYYIKDDDGVLCTAILDDLEVDRQKKTSGVSRENIWLLIEWGSGSPVFLCWLKVLGFLLYESTVLRAYVFCAILSMQCRSCGFPAKDKRDQGQWDQARAGVHWRSSKKLYTLNRSLFVPPVRFSFDQWICVIAALVIRSVAMSFNLQ